MSMAAKSMAMLATLLCACSHSRTDATPAVRSEQMCALVLTDDDIPSGSATAGALYVEEAELGRRLLTNDVVAVAEGFREGGCGCVDVIDSHDGAIDPAPLDSIGVPVLTPGNIEEWTWPFLGPVTRRYRVAALVGYHSKAGTSGFRPHTINDSIKVLEISDRVAGEVTHIILGLGAFDVPVGLVSGDANATEEAAQAVQGVHKVTVRWHDSNNETRFLTTEQAGIQLRDAASRSCRSPTKAFKPRVPINVKLGTHSAAIMRDRSLTISDAWKSQISGESTKKVGLFAGFDFASATVDDHNRLSWQAPNALSAFVSVAFAASYLRGPDNWDAVSQGFSAYTAKRFEDAVSSYAKALKQNPYDFATNCRLGAVYLEMEEVSKAREQFAIGVENIADIHDAPLKGWCWIGLAESESRAGNVEAARQAALRVLELPDFRGRHAEARAILEKLSPK